LKSRKNNAHFVKSLKKYLKVLDVVGDYRVNYCSFGNIHNVSSGFERNSLLYNLRCASIMAFWRLIENIQDYLFTKEKFNEIVWFSNFIPL